MDCIIIGSIIGLVVLLVVLIPLYGLYVSLIQKKNKVRESMGGIDVQLKKRYDLIPNLLTIAQKYMDHYWNYSIKNSSIKFTFWPRYNFKENRFR